MDWSDTLAEGLPAPRDDEPTSLRQDIVDELSDHLRCAMNRELHSVRDEEEAARQVIARFGDPRRIARRLWFDWMKETIMTQRLTLALSVLTAAVCVAALALVWSAIGRNQEINAAILEKLEVLSAQPAAEPVPNLDWSHLTIRLVKGKKSGPPAERFFAKLTGEILQPGKRLDLQKTSDADGIVDFGLVRIGAHELTITTAWGSWRESSVLISPADTNVVEFVCPESPPEEVEISFTMDLPDELRGGKHWFVFDMWSGSRNFGESTWIQKSYDGNHPGRTIVLDETGRQIAWCPFESWHFPGPDPEEMDSKEERDYRIRTRPRDRADGSATDSKEKPVYVSRKLNEFGVPELSFEPVQFPNEYTLYLVSVTVVPALEERKELPERLPARAGTFRIPSDLPNASFTPTSRQENQWRIVLTGQLLERLRANLEPEPPQTEE